MGKGRSSSSSPPGRPPSPRPKPQSQLHELLESDQARLLVEGAEERGFVEPAELEAFAVEHDLSDQEIEEVTRELERIGLEIGQPKAAADAEAPATQEKAEQPEQPLVPEVDPR